MGWWYHHVPRYQRPYAEGDHRSGPIQHEGQDHRPARAQVLCLDRWFHPGLPLDLPADVDLEAGVRRERFLHCAQEVLLSAVLCATSVTAAKDPLVAYLREYGKQRKQRDARSGFSVTVGCSEFESAQASLLHSSVGEWWSRWAAGMAFFNDVLDYLKQFLHTRLRLMLA